MFYGSYICKIDNKSRIYIPASFREVMNNVMVTFINNDNLIIRSSKDWSPELIINDLSTLDLSVLDKEYFLRFIRLSTVNCNIDNQGRILIPIQFRNMLSFEGEVITYGNGDSIVVTNKKKYELLMEEMSSKVEEILNSNNVKILK